MDGELQPPSEHPPVKKNISIIIIIFCASPLFAQPPSRDDAINLPFTGVYRASAKTSIARLGNDVAPVTGYPTVTALIAALPKDALIRSKHPALKPGNHKAPSQRFAEEQSSVRIKDCWILAVNYEKSQIKTDKN